MVNEFDNLFSICTVNCVLLAWIVDGVTSPDKTVQLSNQPRTNPFGEEFFIRLNPPGDGNCQFWSMADQLSMKGISVSHADLRAEVNAVVVHYCICDFFDYYFSPSVFHPCVL